MLEAGKVTSMNHYHRQIVVAEAAIASPLTNNDDTNDILECRTACGHPYNGYIRAIKSHMNTQQGCIR